MEKISVQCVCNKFCRLSIHIFTPSYHYNLFVCHANDTLETGSNCVTVSSHIRTCRLSMTIYSINRVKRLIIGVSQ